MWSKIVISVLLATCISGQEQYSSSSTTPVPIISQFGTNGVDGSFNNSYEAGNGIKVENFGYLKKIKVPQYQGEDGKIVEEHEEEILVQTGSYSYKDPEGNIITLTYVADENGFQPAGSHLPTPPPVQNLDEQVQGQNQIGRDHHHHHHSAHSHPNASQDQEPQQSQYSPGQALNQERQIQQYPNQQINPQFPGQRPIIHRPIQQFPGQQQSIQNRPIQPFPPNQLGEQIQSQPSQPFPGNQLGQQIQSRPSPQFPGNQLGQQVQSRPSQPFPGNQLGQQIQTSQSQQFPQQFGQDQQTFG